MMSRLLIVLHLASLPSFTLARTDDINETDDPRYMFCHFPRYLQAEIQSQPTHSWHTHITNQNHHTPEQYAYVIHFHEAIMKAVVVAGQNVKPRPSHYTRECVEEIGRGKFLVSHHNSEHSREQFMCIEFVKHSKHVVQIKESKIISIPDASLCDEDNLQTNPWPLINTVDIGTTSQPCILEGGYKIKIYNHVNKKGMCDAFDGETRLESECMKGEGMTFRFRYDNCVPKGLQMNPTQKVLCLGSWSEGGYTFTVLRHEHRHYMWSLRYPTVRRGPFKAYLFLDVLADPSSLPSLTKQYISLDTFPDQVIDFSQLCRDDYGGCLDTYIQPCLNLGSPQQLYCPKLCNVCNDDKPKMCTLPTELQHKWLDARDLGSRNTIKVNETFIAVRNFQKFQCVQWEPMPYGFNVRDAEQMFVTTFDNGCRPRYTCMVIKKRAPSLLHIKVSQSQVWPFEKSNGVVVDCAHFNYQDDKQPLKDRFRSKHLKTMVKAGHREYVKCQLRHLNKIDVTFQDDQSCTGKLVEDDKDPEKLVLQLEHCYGKPERQEFKCLDSEKHSYPSDAIIFTEAYEDTNEIVCWFFPMHNDDRFYLLPISECNYESADRIEMNELSPMATFRVRQDIIHNHFDDNYDELNEKDMKDHGLVNALPSLPTLKSDPPIQPSTKYTPKAEGAPSTGERVDNQPEVPRHDYDNIKFTIDHEEGGRTESNLFNYNHNNNQPSPSDPNIQSEPETNVRKSTYEKASGTNGAQTLPVLPWLVIPTICCVFMV